MMNLTLSTIAEKVGKKVIGGTGQEKFKDISIDSRTLEPSDLFVALKGPFNDGHDYLTDAMEKGAVAFVIEKKIPINKPYILVEDCFKFLDQLGTYQREIFNGKVIGLTGSNGKTTTKEIIFSLLEKEGCHKTKGNKNNHIGVPLTLASLTNMQKYAVIEIGTNSPGEINNLSAKVTPDIALIINAAASHLEKLDSVEKVANEKSDILRHLKNDGVAVLPRDSEFFSYWKEKCANKRIISFGFHQDSDIWLRNVQSDFLKNKIPEKFDIIFLDTLHEAQHVKKIFCYYYKFLKTNGFFFIDDTSWLPYVKNNYRDRFYAEINNQETFKILLEIYFSNYHNFDLEFSFVSSGFALAKKLNNNELNSPKKIPSRKLGVKNFMRKILR